MPHLSMMICRADVCTAPPPSHNAPTPSSRATMATATIRRALFGKGTQDLLRPFLALVFQRSLGHRYEVKCGHCSQSYKLAYIYIQVIQRDNIASLHIYIISSDKQFVSCKSFSVEKEKNNMLDGLQPTASLTITTHLVALHSCTC